MSQAISPPAAPSSAISSERRLLVPDAPVLVQDGHRLFCLTLDGELKTLSDGEARQLIAHHMPIVCNGPNIARRLKMDRFHAYDVLELFAFVHPGRFCVPTPRGIARTLNLLEPASPEDQCLSLRDSIRHLLLDLSADGREEKTSPAALAAMMGLMLAGPDNPNAGETGWPWAPVVLAALGRAEKPPSRGEIRVAMKIWDKLPEWSVHAPEPPAGHMGVGEHEVKERLQKLLQRQKKEDRSQQLEYAAGLASAFSPCDAEGETRTVMAEAGTGVGKTLGYLAPATVWAEKNGGAVWVSTYTRNLQRQVDAELDRLYGDAAAKARKVVTRKGRENYLCLLNLEDAAQSGTLMNNDLNATALGLMIRWAAVTQDGDLAGKDFPGWLVSLLGWNRVYGLADRRGECIYSACPHFNKCFIEKSVRKAKRADIVIANHALVMHQTAVNGPEDELPARYVFDEGHHIFDAADSAFCAHLNGTETADLRRWLLGVETQKRTRARGIKRRLEDLITDDEDAQKHMDQLLDAARSLPGPQWRQRLAAGEPKGVAENFLLHCRRQVYARNKNTGGFYSLEAPVQPPVPGLLEAGYALSLRLRDLQKPMLSLIAFLDKKMDEEAETLDSAARERIVFVKNSLYRRAHHVVGGWLSMLHALQNAPVAANDEPGDCVDWLEATRSEGQDHDIGFYRYYVDPAKVFAAHLKPHAQGVAVTSATLRDVSEEDPAGWQSPLQRTGLGALSDDAPPPRLLQVASPFDYAKQTRVIVVKDVDKHDGDQAAAAFRELFLAANGGALGIFTAVQRLRAVHQRILRPLEDKGLHLYGQHVDPLDTGTLIDIFREEENACLLGTDATRDGIDVPGRSLRLVVYDRVPWPRPTILHKARRQHFGKSLDDMLTRFKLKQAFGRLIRRGDDKGVFVMLDAALPTRLTTAFPEGVEVQRIGLAEAVAAVKDFLKE
ncbi:MAG: ATP-dependent DNA helicase [Alphaproteobacteria bacterium]|nr:ATP-dependent DNA helicase [Alphaproteobacteria bacterium]